MSENTTVVLQNGLITGGTISLPDVPEDVFVLVLESLEAWDVIRCQKVSKAWRTAFSSPEHLRLVLKKYPSAREMQNLPKAATDADWKTIFQPVASRYYHMSRGQAKQIGKYKLNAVEQYGQWFPVGQWDYHESQPGGRLYYQNAAIHLSRLGNKPYLFKATLWSYDDGLVAFAPIHVDNDDRNEKYTLSILDVETDKCYVIPFNQLGKVIRGVTLRNRTLVVEWAEKDPYHDLNDNEKVHRHFATCYDVHAVETKDASKNGQAWDITFRNEWKIHFLGLPLNTRDRFFSTHDGTRYAVYFWQPNRSMYTGDEDMPIESLSVWDISTASPYLPSTDPSRLSEPDEKTRAHLISRYSFRELDFIGVRQHSEISLLSLSFESETESLTIRENVCIAGQGYFDPAERLLQATTTTFPFRGDGPILRREWDGDLPPYRGHCSMESTYVEDQEKWFLPVMEVFDETADVRLSLIETCFTGKDTVNRLMVRIKSLGQWVQCDEAIVREVAALGRIAGDERWIVGQNGQMELVVVKF